MVTMLILFQVCILLIDRSAAFRYPAIPLVTLDPFMQIFIRGNSSTSAHATHWTGAEKQLVVLARFDGSDTSYRLLGGDVEGIEAAEQRFVDVTPTMTIFGLEIEGKSINLSFAAPQFAHDPVLMSRPVAFVRVETEMPLHLYMDMSAQHAVNDCNSANETKVVLLNGNTLGKAPPQRLLRTACDECNIDWGYLTLRSANKPSSSYAGPGALSRLSFANEARLPTSSVSNDTILNCSLPNNDFPVIAISTDNAVTSWTALIGYDDLASIDFFGKQLKSLWTTRWPSIENALTDAATQADTIYTDCERFDSHILKDIFDTSHIPLYSLAYRQTMAALKHVIGVDGRPWTFLKEISTNGDINTVDVIFPASPLFLYTNPTLLARLLAPVLFYADNCTQVPFSDPYSVHQLGTYPKANATTDDQEPMPLENTSNMFLMLLALAQVENVEALTLLDKYAALLESWAETLLATAEFPANQLCTDDFAGNSTNNTNLAAKAIIALRAYADLCADPPSCRSIYLNASFSYAQTWNRLAMVVSDGLSHSKLSYDDTNNSTWSLKYNLIFQKLLGFHDEPFTNFDALIQNELAYYASKSLTFGVPLDYRHTYTKVDWLSWIAAVGVGTATANETFNFFFDPILTALQATPDRNPFTDLYFCDNATQVEATGFMARPVVGGIYMHLLLLRQQQQGKTTPVKSIMQPRAPSLS